MASRVLTSCAGRASSTTGNLCVQAADELAAQIREQVRLADSLQGVHPTIVKRDIGCKHESACQFRGEYLIRPGRLRDARHLMHCDSTDVGGDDLDLTNVDSGAHVKPLADSFALESLRHTKAPARDRQR